MTETKARQLLSLRSASFATEFTPADTIEPGSMLDQLLAPRRILLPPLVIGDRAPIAQQIAVPVLATADAALARLEGADAAFHLIVGAWEALLVVALHQMHPQIGELLQERGEALLLHFAERAIGQVP